MSAVLMPLLACAACYGEKGAPVTEHMNIAVLFMLAIVGAMFGGITLFILKLRRQAQQGEATISEI